MRGDDQLLGAARPLSVDNSDWHSAALPRRPKAPRPPRPTQREEAPAQANARRPAGCGPAPWPAVRVCVQCVKRS